MFTRKMFAPLALICALAISISAYGAEDDVFLDEGNGDFDQMPITPDPVAEEQSPVPSSSEAAPAEPMPMLTEEPNTLPDADSSAVAEEQPAPKKKEKKAKVAKTKASEQKAKKWAKKSTPKGGQFVVTKDSCPMLRSPASTSETMLTVKPARKIWVEDAGQGWVKGWNKAGEEGYIAKDCVE